MKDHFKSDLERILKMEKQLVDEKGELNANLIHEYANSLDERLIDLLLSEKTTRDKFFLKVKDVYVFKQSDFKFFLDENKINNSYTQYANRIGLSTGGKFLNDIDDVVLDFPYKDCVLEGGQSTEEGTDTYFEYDESAQDYIGKEAKRKEIFFNHILAKDEIDRLTEPKAFTNIKRYTEKGEEKFTTFNRNENGIIKDNLIFKGNNLLALYSLKEQFQGKIKLIYIDPPYNTGDDEFKYNDKFNHSTWLTFMSNRFKNAEKLLNNEGFLVVQCDDNEQAYLKVLMDNVLNMNFLTTICVQMSYVSGEKMAHINKKPPKIKEYLHIYSKKIGNRISPQYTTKGVDFEYNKYIVKNGSHNSKDWDVVNLNEIFKKHKIKDDEQKEEFMLENASLIFNRVRNKTDVFKNTLGNKKLQKITTPTGLEKWAWNGREVVFLSDRIITDHEGNLTYSQALGDIWDDIPIVNLYLEGGVKLLRGKKPEFLINRIIEMLSKPEDIILDYHLGSGTTAAVCHKNQRQYIGIEQLDYGENDSVVRLKNVINGDSTGISEVVDWKGGGSFVYCELAKNNQNAIDKISSCQSLDELVKLFDVLYGKFFLNYNVKIKEFRDNVCKEKEFLNLSLDRQKEIFARMLDLNQLYVNVSEMEDIHFKLSKEDIAVTKDFYQI